MGGGCDGLAKGGSPGYDHGVYSGVQNRIAKMGAKVGELKQGM